MTNSILATLPRIDGKVMWFLGVDSQRCASTVASDRRRRQVWLLQLSTTSQIFVMVAAVEYAIVELIFRAERRIKDAVASLPREKGEADGGRDDGADESADSAPAPTALRHRHRHRRLV